MGIDPRGYGISAGEINLVYGAGIFQIDDVQPGTLLGDDPLVGIRRVDNERGTLTYALSRRGSTSVPPSSGPFAVVKPTVKEPAPAGTYTILLTKVGLSDQVFRGIASIDLRGEAFVQVISCTPGDINCDAMVDYRDLAVLGAAYGTSKGEPNYIAAADLNNDGTIDYRDLAIVGANYGSSQRQ